ncbi:MAG TPA: ABC transporter ATP-binding protein [Gaiellaceae bacterium]|jgi:ABC-type multidrug transport system fused ATPase/permease subunit
MQFVIGSRKRPLVALVGASVGAGISEATLLALIAGAASAMAAGHSKLSGNLGPIGAKPTLGVAIVIALVMAAVRMGLQLVIAWLPARIGADSLARLRRELFAAYTRASWTATADDSEGSLQELMTGQVMQAATAANSAVSAVSAGIMLLSLVAAAFFLNSIAAVAVLASSGVMFIALKPFTQRGRNAGFEISAASMAHAGAVSESVFLAEEAKVFGAGEAQRARVDDAIERTRRAFFHYQLTNRLAQTIYQSAVIFLIVGGLGILDLANAGNFAALGAIVLILVRASTYGQLLQGSYHQLVQIQPYLERLIRATDRYVGSSPVDRGVPLPAIETLTFEKVSYSYRRGQPVLQDVSFTVPGGEAVGVVGPSGAGKSTMVQILLRLRNPMSGAYLVNGEPIDTFAGADWQRRVAYVPQEPRLLRATVADNIRFLRGLSRGDVVHAAKLAHIHDEIEALPDGYDTLIGHRADAVSGGQRQRICLARALAASPDVLILDEPTSSLDSYSEAAIQESLGTLVGELTLFVVAHRRSLLTICDRILILVDGRLQAFAPAETLSVSNAFFMGSSVLAQ